MGIVMVGVAVVLAVLAYTLLSPFFRNDAVNEAFPSLTQTQRDQLRTMPESQQEVLVAMADDNVEMAAETALAMMETPTSLEEDMPPMDEPVILVQGAFNEFDAVHRGEGAATIYELPDGSRVLRLEDFQVTNGPQLHVILTRGVPTNILDREASANHLDLGALKGNIGSQNYKIPSDVNLDEFQAVVIYCVPFSVNFTTAAFSGV
jgi:hypothetical protein